MICLLTSTHKIQHYVNRPKLLIFPSVVFYLLYFCFLYSSFTKSKCLIFKFSFSDSVRNFKKNMKLGRFNEESVAKQEEALAKKEEEEKAAAEAIAVGNRCKIQVAGQPTKIGTVMFVGKHTHIFIPHLSD